jgi:hypothetical protein
MTGELVVNATTSKMRSVGLGAIVGVILSVALLGLSFLTHSIWLIFPGVYAVAWVVGIHNASMFAVAVVNSILLWILATSFLTLYQRRSGR